MINIYYFDNSKNYAFIYKNKTKISILDNTAINQLTVSIHVESINDEKKDFTYNIDKERYKGKSLALKAFEFCTESRKSLANQPIINPAYIQTDIDPHDITPYSSAYMKFAKIFIPKDYTNNPILCQLRIDIPNEDILTVNSDKYELNKLDYTTMNVDGFFCRYSQEYRDLFNDWKLKYSNITGMTSISDSVAYLEEEVDLLYKILNVLLTRFSSEIDVSEYKELLDTINSNSVINVKSKEKILDDLKTHKNRVRDLQENYYKEKYEGK